MTVYNRTIQIRLTKEEKEKILRTMGAEGHHNLSAWLRQKLLTDALWPEQKIDEVYRYVMEQKRNSACDRKCSRWAS